MGHAKPSAETHKLASPVSTSTFHKLREEPKSGRSFRFARSALARIGYQ
jgi:hypothetical protein